MDIFETRVKLKPVDCWQEGRMDGNKLFYGLLTAIKNCVKITQEQYFNGTRG